LGAYRPKHHGPQVDLSDEFGQPVYLFGGHFLAGFICPEEFCPHEFFPEDIFPDNNFPVDFRSSISQLPHLDEKIMPQWI
jgi:hypothetical protein